MFLPRSLLFNVTLKSISRQGSRPSPSYCAHSPLTLGVSASQRSPRPAGNSSEPLLGQTPGDAPTDTVSHATTDARDRAHAALPYAAPVSPFPFSSGSSSGLGDHTHQTQPGQPGRPARPGPRPKASAVPLLTVSTPEPSSLVPSVSSPTAASSTVPGPPSGSRSSGCNSSGSGGACSIAAVWHRESSAPAPCLGPQPPRPLLAVAPPRGRGSPALAHRNSS